MLPNMCISLVCNNVEVCYCFCGIMVEGCGEGYGTGAGCFTDETHRSYFIVLQVTTRSMLYHRQLSHPSYVRTTKPPVVL